MIYDYPADVWINPCVAKRPKPDDLGAAIINAISTGELEARDLPLEHYFAEGLYGRRIFCKEGDVIVTKKHKTQHITIALVGSCIVSDEDGNNVEIAAPGVWITEPGTQRSVFCLTDVEWITVHANPDNERDITALEDRYATNTLNAVIAAQDIPKKVTV